MSEDNSTPPRPTLKLTPKEGEPVKPGGAPKFKVTRSPFAPKVDAHAPSPAPNPADVAGTPPSPPSAPLPPTPPSPGPTPAPAAPAPAPAAPTPLPTASTPAPPVPPSAPKPAPAPAQVLLLPSELRQQLHQFLPSHP